MYVVKRDGHREPVHFDKISNRITRLAFGLDMDFIDPTLITQKVCSGVYKGVTTTELDELAAETAANLSSTHPDYAILAARIAVSNLHKNTKKLFSAVIHDLYSYVEPKTGLAASLISDYVYKFIMENADTLNSAIVYGRDFEYDYFGFKTLERAYLLRLDGTIAERPQQMLMRVACGIHYNNLEKVLETYNYMSQGWFTHASPTLFNAGTPRPQLSSCFLLTMKEDSIEGIYDTLKTCAIISKHAGGIGIACHNIRASNSYVRGTNGTSNGLIPMLRVYNNTARYVDQGGGKRKGAFAMYLEPWHPDVFDFIDVRKNHGIEEHRARDLFVGLWICDLFMKRVENNELWSLFCPDECPGLADCWGEEFDKLYLKYENHNKARKVIKARTLWSAILEAQQETGVPYMLYKDSCNRKSNQQNLGTIRSSNLCTEIVEYTSPDEVAVCNLASINLSNFVVQSITSPSGFQSLNSSSVSPRINNTFSSSTVSSNGSYFDFQKLYEVTKVVTRNLNRVIDITFYPVPEAKLSNLRHRPIGLGVQGLADAFILLEYPYESDEAQELNRRIFETIYFASLETSCEMAQEDGPYETYQGSPVSKGILQFDMWNVKPDSSLWNWSELRDKIAKHGVRNSLLVAPMPTASTSQILGNNESFEPYTYNLYTRRTLAGEFVCVNKHLLRSLIKAGLWSETIRSKLIAMNGSIQHISEIPANIRELFKTVWEMKGKVIIDMAADRGAYIDQSQSFNVHMSDVNFAKLTSMHFYAWKKGLKTGMYYLRTKAAADAIKFTVDTNLLKETQASAQAQTLAQAQIQAQVQAQSQAQSLAQGRIQTDPSSISFNPNSKMSGSTPSFIATHAVHSVNGLNTSLNLSTISNDTQHTSIDDEIDTSLEDIERTLSSTTTMTSVLSSASNSNIVRPLTNAEQYEKRVAFSAKATASKAEREDEEELRIAQWRAERDKKKKDIMCALDNKDECLSCGS